MAMAKKVVPRFKANQVRRKTYFKEWRKFRGMTLEAAAEASGMTAGNISAMERGAQNYTQNGLEALAEAYRCQPGQLLNVDPTQPDAIWSIWEKAKMAERQEILSHAQYVLDKARKSAS